MSLSAELERRAIEIKDVIRLITFAEKAIPRVMAQGSLSRRDLSADTLNVIKAGTFVQIYNLIEGTVESCLRHVASDFAAAQPNYNAIPRGLQESWVRPTVKPGAWLGDDKRIAAAIDFGVAVCAKKPPVIETEHLRQGGTLNFTKIEEAALRCSVALKINKATKKALFVQIGSGALVMDRFAEVAKRRNDLAHGTRSYGECGSEVSAADLRGHFEACHRYLKQYVSSFEKSVSKRSYLTT